MTGGLSTAAESASGSVRRSEEFIEDSPRARGPVGALSFRFFGAVLLVLPFLPLRRLFGELEASGALVGPFEWLLGLIVFGTLAWLVAASPLVRYRPTIGRPPATRRLSGGLGRVLGLGVLAVLLATVSAQVFAHRPLLVDSVVQLFQARIFATGHITAPAPALPEFFASQHLLVDENGWYSQYPPGHAALLAIGVVLGAPWLVPIGLTVGSVWFLHRFAATAYGEATGRLTLLLALLCPFMWFMGASFMNHVSSLFFIALALWFLARWEGGARDAYLIAGGLALGGAFLSRPLTALAVGIVLGASLLPRVWARRATRIALAAFGAAIGVSAVYLLFNQATTGDALLPGYVKMWGAAHGLGFHETPWGGLHTPLTGLRNEVLDLSLLALHTFEWPVPAFLPAAALFLTRADNAWDRRLLLGFLAIPAAYFFYWHRDAYLGPRFLYSSLVFLLPLTARGLQACWRRLRPLQARPGLLRPDPRAFLIVFLLGCFAYSLVYGAPQRFRVYASGMGSMKVDLAENARAAGIEEGVVFVAVSWGNRLLTRLRAAGAEPALTERVYRTAEHCEIHELLEEAQDERWPAARLASELRNLPHGRGALITTPRLNGDPTLRVNPARPLTPSCMDEILYDRRGYSIYTPHLLSIPPDLSGPLIFARDLREENARLRSQYPDRPAYLYRAGRLLRLSDG